MAGALDVRVRPHVLLGAGLVALAALGAAAVALFEAPLAGYVTLLLALVGFTLLLSGVALWYLPSFAKRAVTPALLARTLPALGGLFLAALALHVVASLVGRSVEAHAGTLAAASVAAALLVLLLAVVLVASVLLGPPWRGGAPFWRKPGDFQAGDRAALVAFGASVAWLLATALLLASEPANPLAPRTLLSWLAALFLLVLGSLAHLLPRGRGVPLRAPVFFAGVVVLALGALLLLLPRPPRHAPLAFAAGLALSALALGLQGGGRGKPQGPRQREARPLLLAAWIVLVGASVPFAATPWRPDLVFFARAGLAVALFLGVAALSILTLPVLFNQRPDARFLAPAALAAVAGDVLLVAGTFAEPALVRWAILALALSILLWLAALWPLRTPRRECPV